ncbi:MAG: hypothetical protein K0S32_761 [Bacteroidetes bacterium]|jgi:hypothetical protein|nr:hypothetical protein [Bacteroidota bacterium]
MKKQLIPFLLFFFYITASGQVYSPYYYLDTLKDKGLTSDLHAKYKNKFFFGQEHSTITNGTKANADKCITEFNKNHNISAGFYLDRSLRYYYAKYQNDKNLNFADWNYGPWKGNYSGKAEKNTARYVGCLVYVLVVDGDTAGTWKTSLPENTFETETVFEFQFWYEADDKKHFTSDRFCPLLSYVKSKKKVGTYEARIDVYAGKLVCNNIYDRGPDRLSTGSIKLNVSKEDMDFISDLNISTKVKFKDYDFENEILWGVKQ